VTAGAWLTLLVLLPAATWLLGALLNLRDQPEPAAAVGRVVRALLPFLAAALLLGAAAATPVLVAVATALLLHMVWSVGLPLIMRRRARRGSEDL
jgi:hypothetical protein